MGGSIAAWLIDAGHAVQLVDRDSAHVQAINESGLEITGPVRSFRVAAPASLPSELSGTFQTVLLCVKAHHTDSAIRSLAKHVAPAGFVVSVQNGLNERLIAEVVGAHRTVGAFVNFGADVTEPGVVMRGNRGAVVLGELDGSTTDRITQLQRTLVAFEPNTKVTENILGYLWAKLGYGALLFATATTHMSIADALAARQHRLLYIRLGREVCAIANRAGIQLEPFDGFDPSAFHPDADIARADSSLDDLVTFNRGSAKTHSGIWRDIAVRKRKTEADAQLGAIVDEAARLQTDAPITRALLSMMHEIELGDRQQDDRNLDELLAVSLRPGGPA